MTPERAKELLPVIKAFSEGKEIEFRHKDDHPDRDRWMSVKNISFDSEFCVYRVKPIPITRWTNARKNGGNLWSYESYPSKKDAESALPERYKSLYTQVSYTVEGCSET